MKLFIFFMLSFLFLETPSCVAESLIQETCKKASQVNYTLCITALESDPRSPTADLAGLGSISIQLALANATQTWSHIQEMLKSGRFDSYDKARLEDCLELYSEAISNLTESLKALKDKSYLDVNVQVSAAMTDSDTCEDGFKEKAGRVSPSTEENYYLSQLGSIALAIVVRLR